MPPTIKHGKVCYLQIPANDVDASGRFYQEVFGWSLRRHGDGTLAFDDPVGELSGSWVQGRAPWAGEPGLLIYVMVGDAIQAVAAIEARGGEIVQPIGGSPGGRPVGSQPADGYL